VCGHACLARILARLNCQEITFLCADANRVRLGGAARGLRPARKGRPRCDLLGALIVRGRGGARGPLRAVWDHVYRPSAMYDLAWCTWC
jgi:hypothetical protein